MDYSNGGSFGSGGSLGLVPGEPQTGDGTRPPCTAWMCPGDPLWRGLLG